jgi:hypothetical protein
MFMKKLIALGVVCHCAATQLFAQNNPVITSFSQNGELVCTNLQPGTTATVEWAPTLDGPWTNAWAGLDSVTVGANASIQVSVPMFYRVRGIAVQPQAIETSVTALDVLEGGSTNFGIRLTAQPTNNVTIAISSSDPTKVSAGLSLVVFTPANWNTYQYLTVSGVNDADAANDGAVIYLQASGLTLKFVTVSVTDDEVQNIVVSTNALTIGEAGSGNFTVRLAAQPLSTTTVTVNSDNTAQATVSPASLNFTTSNWNTPQTVTANGVNDANAANGSVNVTASATNLTTRTVAVTVVDDDVLDIETSVTSVTVNEAGSGFFGVRLTAQPASTTTITIASQDAAKATVSLSSLFFTTANWNNYQNVTVSGVNDPDTNNESLDITVSSAGLTSRLVNITVTDDD